MNAKTSKMIDKWHRDYYETMYGPPFEGDSFAKVQKRFEAWFAKVERLAHAVRNPLAEGSAAVIYRSDGYWDFQELSDHLFGELISLGAAIRIRGDKKKLAGIAARLKRLEKKNELADKQNQARNHELCRNHGMELARRICDIHSGGVLDELLSYLSIDERRQLATEFAERIGVNAPALLNGHPHNAEVQQ